MPVIFNNSTIGTSDIGVTVQGYDSDLTAIAALATTAYGRGLLAAADSSGITVQSGTWTPAYVLSVSGSVTAGTATGIWFRMGKFVFCTGFLSSSTLNSPVGNVNLTIPFAAATSAQCAAAIGASGWNTGLTYFNVGLDASYFGQTVVVLNKGLPNAGYIPVVASDLGSSGNAVRYSLFYEAA